jgi:5-formyltetrahydrofolate cyclo-ligase
VPSTFHRMLMPDSLTPLQEEKQRLRAEMRAKRLALTSKNKNLFNQLAVAFKHHIQVEPGAVVAAYSPFRNEIDGLYIIEALRAQGCKIALPRIVGKKLPLAFHLIEPGGPLVANHMGILEPPATSPPVDPDIVLVPLLAFDRLRHRLGYGGGYYDRTLSRLRTRKSVRTIGLAYAWQEIMAVPIGATDIALDKIVTELNVF